MDGTRVLCCVLNLWSDTRSGRVVPRRVVINKNQINMYDKVTFEEAVKPLMKWLCENKHPHTTAIVTGNVAELVEGVEVVKTDEFLVD